MMNPERPHHESEPTASVNQIAAAARENELTRERFAEIRHRRHGAVNCYPGQPTRVCHSIAYFLAPEARLGRKIQLELAHDDREADPPVRWWMHRRWRYWEAPAVYQEPPFTFAHMLERLVRHMQGSCAGTTRQAVLITDTWSAPAFERWRSNLETIRQSTGLAIYRIGEGVPPRVMSHDPEPMVE